MDQYEGPLAQVPPDFAAANPLPAMNVSRRKPPTRWVRQCVELSARGRAFVATVRSSEGWRSPDDFR